MPGPDLQPVRVGLEALERAIECAGRGFHRARDVGRLLQQVRPADVAHEHEITRHDADRLVCGGPVGDQKGKMFRRVAGRVHGIDLDVAHAERVAVAQQHGAGLGGEGVFPVRIPLVRQVQRGARMCGERARARDEVGVDMRLGDEGDAHAFGGRGVDILCDVAVGVDDDRNACLPAADEVARLGKLRIKEPTNDHANLLQGCGAKVSYITIREYGESRRRRNPAPLRTAAARAILRGTWSDERSFARRRQRPAGR